MLTQTPDAGHIPADPFAPTLPDAETVAQSLGGRKAGANDWRLAHLCGGAAPGTPLGNNPGLSVGNAADGGLIVKCFYGCDNADAYAAVRAALGIENRRPTRPSITPWLRCPDCDTHLPADRMIPGTGWPALMCSCGTSYDRLISAVVGDPWTAWAEYLLADGKPRRMVRRFPPRSGKSKTTWEQEPDGPDGKRPHRAAAGLTPLVWQNDTPDSILLIVEGEKAGAALVSAAVHELGYTTVSTQSAAGMATADYADIVAGRHVIVWPDDDPPNERTGRRPGPEAARKAGRRILAAGAISVRLVDSEATAALVPDGGKGKGADAADVPTERIHELLDDAAPFQLQEANRNPNTPEDPDPFEPATNTPDAPDEDDDAPARLSDDAALVKHQADNILRIGNNIALRTPGNLWLIYDHSDRDCRGLLTEMVRDARVAEGADPDRSSPSDGTINSVVNQLVGRARRGAFRRVNRSDFDRSPLVPFTDDTHLHLDQRLPEACDCRLDQQPTIDHGWEIPPPDWEETQLPHLLNHFDPDHLVEIAQRLWSPDKSCDFLLNPHSGAGKSTLSTVLAQCLPGMVYRIDASEIKEQRMAFSVHTKPLTSSRIVIYDEAARAGVKWSGVLYAMTDEDIDINEKHQQEARFRRIGTPMFFGPDQPDIDTSQQGIETRIGAVWQLRAKPYSVDANMRALWLSDTELSRLRVWLLEVALRGPRDNSQLSDRAAREEFVAENEDELTADIREALDHLDPAELYHMDELTSQLTLAHVEIPQDRNGDVDQTAVAQAIRAAFPGAASKKRRRPGEGRDGKAIHLWANVGLKGINV